MASLRMQNALLFVIAVCLVLLVVHFYSGHLVAKAQAQAAPEKKAPSAAKVELPPLPDPKGLNLFGCRPDTTKGSGCNWIPVRVDEFGQLVTTEPK